MSVLQVTRRKEPKQGLLLVSITNTVSIVGVTVRMLAKETGYTWAGLVRHKIIC